MHNNILLLFYTSLFVSLFLLIYGHERKSDGCWVLGVIGLVITLYLAISAFGGK